MNRTTRILFGFVTASLILGSTGGAQGVTRKAPTAADWASLAKLPDFNGVWESAPGGGGGRGAAGRAGRGGGPSLTPDYAAKDKAGANNPAEEAQAANCLPPGLPAIMNQPYPMEILLTPGKVTIVIEAYTQVRHIYTDGRELPEDPNPGFFGTSIGHWEGDTLVVESVGFNDLVTIGGVPHSDQMKITERFNLRDDNTLQVE